MKTWAILLFTLLAGCASTKPSPPALEPLFTDAAFGAPSEPVSTDRLFELSPEMQAYLHSPAFKAHLRNGAERGLVDALYRKSDLKIEYDASKTRTAAQTYAARAGNCLSLVVMTAAFARELGMQVRFQSVDADRNWSRKGGIYLSSAHVNLALGPKRSEATRSYEVSGMLVVDFLPPEDMAGYRTHPLDEDDIVGMYMNNRAAEALVLNKLDDAYWWARGALARDASSSTAYNTLGVVYQRHGDLAQAEKVFRAALVREPENILVMQNLVPVLNQLGKGTEAGVLERRVASIEPNPPYYFFHRGMTALYAGQFGQAKTLFAREVARAPYNDEFHFWLAIACLNLGEKTQARAQLALALDTSTTDATRGLYSSKLAQLAGRARLN